MSQQTFLQRHWKLLLAAALLLLAFIAAAVTLPLVLKKGKGDSASATSTSKAGKGKKKGDDKKVKIEEEKDGKEAVDAADVKVKEAKATKVKKPKPAAKKSYNGPNCVYAGGNGVIVMDGKVPQQGSQYDWETRDNGVEFRPSEGNPHRVFNVDESPPRDYRFTVAQAGRYIVSAVTSAGGNTDFNDMWMHFGYGGGFEFRHFRSGQVSGGGTGYYKAYQNDGYNKVGIFTIDHHPHVFSTKDELKPGTVYTLRIVGRASRFTLQRLLLQRCDGGGCAGTGENRQQLKDAAFGNFASCVD